MSFGLRIGQESPPCFSRSHTHSGFEGMFGPSQEVPLPHAVTDYLDYDGKKALVHDSMVSIEIENGAGDFLTVQRSIAGERARHLMTVYEGRAITARSGLEVAKDYFVRERFAATSQRGFHRYLAGFLGWNLPMAPRFNDEDCPLYLETIFPLLFVEQKVGWGRIPARFPTYLGIRDVARRAVEFLMGLDAYAIAIERSAVQDEIGRIRTGWTNSRTQIAKLASVAAGVSNGIPSDPISSWPPEVPPEIYMPRGGEWMTLPIFLGQMRERLFTLQSQEVPSAAAAEPRVKAELENAEAQLAEKELVTTAIAERLESDLSEIEALKQST